MIYNELAPGIKVSSLGVGVMRYNSNDQREFARNIDYAIEHGVNYFEACWFYLNGNCESLLAQALSSYKRDSYVLADKLPVHGFLEQLSPEQIWTQQIKNCKTEYFDSYLLQALDRNSLISLEKHRVLDFVDNIKRAGDIRSVGFSFHDTPEYLERYLSMYDWDFVQLQLNYYDWFWTMGKELYEIADKHNTNIVAMGPVKGGTLSNNLPVEAVQLLNNLDHTRSIASWAMRFINDLPRVKVILTGAERLDMLKDNIELFNFPSPPLTEAEINTLKHAVEIYRQRNYIQCTGCGYCKCSQGINIPKIFSLYNSLIQNYSDKKMEEMLKVIKEEPWSTSCVGCRRCEMHCPQHLPISHYLHGNVFQLRA